MEQERVDIKTPEYVSLQFQTAGLGSRAIAMIIDQFILSVVNIFIFIALFLIADKMFTGDSLWPLAIVIILIFFINWGYFFISESFFGGKTIGKHVTGIRVIQENGHGLTILSSFIRNLLRMIDMLPSGYFIGIMFVFFHSKHKRLGDITAGTIVVHERSAKRKKKPTALEKEIQARGLTADSLAIAEWGLNAIGTKEWHLIKTYCLRLPDLQSAERKQLTEQVASIIFPKIGLDLKKKTNDELENTLLVLYLKLKDEWEFAR